MFSGMISFLTSGTLKSLVSSYVAKTGSAPIGDLRSPRACLKNSIVCGAVSSYSSIFIRLCSETPRTVTSPPATIPSVVSGICSTTMSPSSTSPSRCIVMPRPVSSSSAPPSVFPRSMILVGLTLSAIVWSAVTSWISSMP